MRFCIFIVFIFIVFASCHRVSVSSIREGINTNDNHPVVIRVDTTRIFVQKIGSQVKKYIIQPNDYIKFYDHDPLGDREKVFLEKITLDNADNVYDLYSSLLYVDKVTRMYEGNYADVRKIAAKGPSGLKVVMKIYKVEDIENLVQYYYWHPERELTEINYESALPLRDTIHTNFHFGGILRADNPKTVTITLMNKFLRNNSFCNPCTEIDLLRENLKFDMHELIQRKLVKKYTEKYRTTGERFILYLGTKFYDMEEVAGNLARLDKIKDIETLKKASLEINQELQLLEDYAEKVIPAVVRLE